MNKVLGAFAFAALAGSLATPASATDQNIPLQATVTSFCKIAGSLTPADDALQTINVTDGFVNTGQTITRPFNVVCNKASTVSLAAKNGGLSTAASAAGFDNIINYTAATTGFAVISPAGDTATVATAVANSYESLGSTTRATPGSASISVVITPTVNTLPLVEGTYNDVVRLSIVPN
jgi:hypothetical protein